MATMSMIVDDADYCNDDCEDVDDCVDNDGDETGCDDDDAYKYGYSDGDYNNCDYGDDDTYFLASMSAVMRPQTLMQSEPCMHTHWG